MRSYLCTCNKHAPVWPSAQVGERTSLRHAVQLLTPASMLARTNGRDAIVRGDLEDVDNLFHDAKYSARLLAEQADKYIS